MAGVTVGQLEYLTTSNSKQFERDMDRLPGVVKKASDKVVNEARRRAAAEMAVEKRFASASKSRKRQITAAVISELRRQESAHRSHYKKINSMASRSRTILGGIAGGLVVAVTNELRQIPGLIDSEIAKSVKVAESRINAAKGLSSISIFKGINPNEANKAVRGLRLVKAGIVDVGQATTGLKNLLATGFSLPQAIKIMERFSDASAFGKQAALTYGRALESATEGIKNQNSQLADNVGLTKNISKILEEYGFKMEDLSDKTKSQNAINALYKGILSETAAQVGDADKLTQSYTGSVASLTQAKEDLRAEIGLLITQSPVMREANKIQTEQIQGYTTAIKDADSETAKFARNSIIWWARLKAHSLGFANFTVTVVQMAGKSFALLVDLTVGTILGILEVGTNNMQAFFTGVQNSFAGMLNGLIDMSRKISGIIPGLGLGLLGDIEKFDANKSPVRIDLGAGDTFRDAGRSFGDLQRLNRKRLAILDERDANEARLAKAEKEYAEELRKGTTNRKLRRLDREKERNDLKKAVGGSSGGGGRGRRRQALTKDDRSFRDLVAFGKSMGFDITSTTGGKHNRGSIHGIGKAVDFRTKNKTDQEVAEFIAAAIKKGFRIVDERVRPRKGAVWSGPHLHGEINPRKESFLNPKLSYGNVPIGFLRKLDNDRFEKGRGFRTADVDSFKRSELRKMREQSDRLTREKQERKTRGLEKLAMSGIIQMTDSLANDIARLRNRKLSDEGKARITGGDVYSEYMQKKPIYGPITSAGPGISTDISFQPLEALPPLPTASQYGLVDLTEEMQALRGEFEHLEDNKGLIERVRLKREEVSLTSEINTLRGEIDNFDVNSNQRIEVELLRQKLDYLRQEEDATISIILAQERLSRTWEISQNRINASIWETLAAQKDLTEIMSDSTVTAINGTYEAMNRGISGLIERIGLADTALGDFLQEFLSGLAKIAINRIFQMLFGSLLSGFGGGTGIGGHEGGHLFPGAADGGWFNPKGGGHVIRVGEAGHKEVVISTDPAKRARSTALLTQAAEQIMPSHSLPKGVTNGDVNFPGLTAKGRSEGGQTIYIVNKNTFVANENGEFSKPSAHQTALEYAEIQEKAMRRK